MIDWKKQSEEMFKVWTESQQKMWNSWLETVQQNPAQAPMTDMWKKTVETWEEMAKNVFSAQTEWARMWTENLSGMAGLPKEVVEWAQQAQEMTRRWSEAQQQLWQDWFEIVKKVDPAKMPANWDGESQKMFQSWQESTQKIMEAQAEWTRMWQNQAKTVEKN